MIKIEGLYKNYKNTNIVNIFDGISLNINKGEVVSLLGHSGSGKSTLLHICGLLEGYEKGSLILDGIECSKLSDKEKTNIRLQKIGFIYQNHYLIQELTVLENVCVPLVLQGYHINKAKKQAMQCLESVHMEHRSHHFPRELSGGEQQRTSIARAVVKRPVIVIADEPTGNLDYANAHNVTEIFLMLAKNYNATTLIATHNQELASKTDRILHIVSGHIV